MYVAPSKDSAIITSSLKTRANKLMRVFDDFDGRSSPQKRFRQR